jgi:predicted amidohydrolase
MSSFRIALANLSAPSSGDDAVTRSLAAIDDAARAGAKIVCFPEDYVPGYRALAPGRPAPDPSDLAGAVEQIAAAAGRAEISVVLGTERFVAGAYRLSVVVIAPDGEIVGWQDKVQLDPSEDALYRPGTGRRVFTIGELTFGVVICHEGFRYPETVRWAARSGAQLVFHPHYTEAEGGFVPTSYADPRNTFHEAAARCRAAENTIWYATVNCASAGSPTTSAIVRPDGTLLVHQPHGESGLLLADLDLSLATGKLAQRWIGVSSPP